MKRLIILLGAALLLAKVGVSLVACYDPKSPNLPTCTGREEWPDPCAARGIPDAGKDG